MERDLSDKSPAYRALAKILADDDGVTLRSYSGRGMYGKSCFGVSSSYGDPSMHIAMQALRNADELDQEEREELADALGNSRSDSLGRGVIRYFPDVEPYEDESDDDDDDESEVAAR